MLVRGEGLELPYRIYSAEPRISEVLTLSDRQKLILACVYTRHHDGFVRERHLPDLLTVDEPWVPPFVLMLLGEYVIEICQVFADRLEDLPQTGYATFAAENPGFVSLTCSRVVSDWDCYDRSVLNGIAFTEHPAYRVLASLSMWARSVPRRWPISGRATGQH